MVFCVIQKRLSLVFNLKKISRKRISSWQLQWFSYNALSAMSLEIPPIIFLDWCNLKGRKCRRHEHTAPSDHWERSPIKQGGGGYNAAKGLISRKITALLYCRHFQQNKVIIKEDIRKYFFDWLGEFKRKRIFSFVTKVLFAKLILSVAYFRQSKCKCFLIL